MAIRRTTATAELHNGEILGPVRVSVVDKLAASRTCRARGWDIESYEATTVMGWAALNRTKLTELGYEEFLDHVIDLSVDLEDAESEPHPEDPTHPER